MQTLISQDEKNRVVKELLVALKEARNLASAAVIEANQMALAMLKDIRNDPEWLDGEEGKEMLKRNAKIILNSKGVRQLGELIEEEYGDYKRSIKSMKDKDEEDDDDKLKDDKKRKKANQDGSTEAKEKKSKKKCSSESEKEEKRRRLQQRSRKKLSKR